MRKVNRWICDDGRTFDKEDDAKSYEVECETVKELALILDGSLETGRSTAILRHIVLEGEAIRKVLARHAKRLPRVKRLEV